MLIHYQKSKVQLTHSVFGTYSAQGLFFFQRHMVLRDSSGSHIRTLRQICALVTHRKHCAVQGERLFAFERYMVFRKSGGNHCQVNALAVPAAAAEGAADVLTRAAEAAGFALMPLKGPHEVCLSRAVNSTDLFGQVSHVHCVARGTPAVFLASWELAFKGLL